MKKFFSKRNIIIILAISLAGYYFYSSYSSTGGSKRSGNKKSSTTARATTGTFETIVTSTGVIAALSSVDVKSRVGGNVEYLKLMEGDVVKKGDLVATIDKRNILLKVKQTESDLKSAKAMLEKEKLSYESDKRTYQNDLQRAQANIEINRASFQLLKKGSRPEEISQGMAQLDLANANYENARKNYERQKELFGKNLIPQASLDSAKASMDVMLAQVRTAKDKLALLQQGYQSEDIQKAQSQYEVALFNLEDTRIKIDALNIRQQQVLNLEAAAQKAESLYQDAMEQLKDTTVLAPISGIVTQKWVDEGGIITSGISSITAGTNIITLSDLSEVLIKANVDETDVYKLKNNLEARVSLDAFPKRKFRARLSSIGPRVYLKDNVPVIDVTLELLEGTDEVKVGMTADADIIIHSQDNVRMIPSDSIIERQGKLYVKVITGRSNGNSSAYKEIKIGESNGEKTVLLEGLSDNDVFLTGEALKDEKSSSATANPGMPLLGSPPRGGGGRR